MARCCWGWPYWAGCLTWGSAACLVTHSPQNGRGALAQTRLALAMAESTPIPLSAIPRWWLVSGGLGSVVIECLIRTRLKLELLKSGPLSVRTYYTHPLAPVVPWRTTVLRNRSNTAGTWVKDLSSLVHLVRVASSTMSRKYQQPEIDATGCLPLQSRMSLSRNFLTLVVAVSGWDSLRCVPMGHMLHLSISLTYLRSWWCLVEDESLSAWRRTSSEGWLSEQ